MLALLIKKFKNLLTMLLLGALLLSNTTVSESIGGVKEYIKYTIGGYEMQTTLDEEIPAWAIRKCDVIVRVGEWNGKSGKRVYINNGVNWNKIPTDIPIHKDSKGYYIQEFDINKKIATKVYNELIKNGVNAKLQIANGRTEDLNAAGRIANESNPKLYLSIHTNCYNGKASGYFSMYNQGSEIGKGIANRLSSSIENNGMVARTQNRSQDGYIGELNVLNGSTCGVLMELGFFDNYEELVNICSDKYANYVGVHLAKEIKSVLNDYWKKY